VKKAKSREGKLRKNKNEIMKVHSGEANARKRLRKGIFSRVGAPNKKRKERGIKI